MPTKKNHLKILICILLLLCMLQFALFYLTRQNAATLNSIHDLNYMSRYFTKFKKTEQNKLLEFIYNNSELESKSRPELYETRVMSFLKRSIDHFNIKLEAYKHLESHTTGRIVQNRFHLQFQSDYLGLHNFLSILENGPLNIKIESLDLASNPEMPDNILICKLNLQNSIVQFEPPQISRPSP